jgi:hypothetical protein
MENEVLHTAMEYRDIEYQIIANPSGWKWIVFLDATRTRTGISHTRADAVLNAERTIDKATGRESNGPADAGDRAAPF